jgi:orotidine-5'-phosphate decarboxylase
VTEGKDGDTLYEKVLKTSSGWQHSEQLMYVVGATRPEYFERIRKIVPDHFLLVPGVGAQGGDLRSVCSYGMNREVGLLINSSRGIIYASSGDDFAASAREKAMELRNEMDHILSERSL